MDAALGHGHANENGNGHGNGNGNGYGRGQNGLRRQLQLEVLRVLNGTGQFQLVPEHVPQTTGLTERIYRRLSNDTEFALPRAIYENTRYKAPIRSYLTRREIHQSEWRYLTKLAKTLNVPPHHGQEEIGDPPPWMIDVDEAYQELRVWVRELALQDMLLAAMESYLVPAGSGRPSTEIYGLMFGSYRISPQAERRPRRPSLVDLNIERICIQHRAKGNPSAVTLDERSEVAQLAMGEELFPFWHVLGDFHTHTYRTLNALYESGGWQYSDADEAVNIDWCKHLRGLGHRPRVALILAITRAGRQGGGSEENWNGLPHVMRTTIGKCHCFLSAYRIRPDGRYSTEAITLKCPHLVGH